MNHPTPTFADMKRGIILMNLGSPDSTEVKDVRRYLNEFLMDERVIDYPYIFRLLLVRGIIVPLRAPKSAEAYRSIWWKEGSPLIEITKQLQGALQSQVEEPVEIAMRYGNPSVKQAYENMKAKGVEEVIAIPMYPHYAMSSYETAVEYAKEIYKKEKYQFKLEFIKPYYEEAKYLEALADSIKPYLEQDYDQILFSYHGIPERHLKKGDITGKHCLKVENCCDVDSPAHSQCYSHQCWVTTKRMVAMLGIPEGKYAMSFQSRLGREEWLKPYTAKRLEELPGEGVKKLLIVCPAFVSDCLETLEEIAEEGKHSFMESGGEAFTIIPCLNVHPLWVKAIAGWVDQVKQGNQTMILQ